MLLFGVNRYFNALICRHDHQGAEDAEMGWFNFITLLNSLIYFSI